MVITAEQARKLAKPKDISEKLDEYLDEIYNEIEECASVGLYDTSITLKSFASTHKEYLSAKLRNNGYKVKFRTANNVREECSEYFIISWKER
jgi:hypothetical protein